MPANVFQMAMERKLNSRGHVCRMNNSRLTKQVVFGMVEGTGTRGRNGREWFDDIKEWCQMDAFSEHLVTIHNRLEAVDETPTGINPIDRWMGGHIALPLLMSFT